MAGSPSLVELCLRQPSVPVDPGVRTGLGASAGEVIALKSAFSDADYKHEINPSTKARTQVTQLSSNGVRQVRFKELLDVDGMVLAQDLHPAIAVVAADDAARAAAIAAVPSDGSTKILSAPDVDQQLRRATAMAAEQHAASVDQKRARVADAEQSLKAATAVALNAAHDTSVAVENLARIDDLATRLSSAEAAYEAAVRADAEAGRSLAADLSELERVLGQRRSASTTLENARAEGDGGDIPEAIVQQALNVQATLADAEKEKYDAVQRAEEISNSARAVSRDAMVALGSVHDALRSATEVISSGAPDWGPGLPLPGLVTNYRGQLAAAVPVTRAAESEAKEAERSARAHLEQERLDLDALIAAGPPSLDPRDTIEIWVRSDYFAQADAVFADDAFTKFSPEAVSALITALAARGGQVIYLTDNPDVLGWAIGIPHNTGAAATIPSSRVRKPVLIEVSGSLSISE
jgi:hypothetical protein